MNLLDVIKYIEEIATEILISEYTDEKSYVEIDQLNYSFIEENTASYNLVARAGAKERHVSFETSALAGLPMDLTLFETKEAFTLAVLLANLCIQALDEAEDYDEEEKSRYILDTTDKKILC